MSQHYHDTKRTEDIIKKGNYKLMSLMNINVKIIDKILVNLILQYVKMIIHHNQWALSVKLMVTLTFKNKSRGLTFSALTHKELGNHHSCLFNKKKLNKLKINDFSWIIQRIELSGQTASWNLERQVNTENHSWDQPKWNKSCWYNKLVRTLKW